MAKVHRFSAHSSRGARAGRLFSRFERLPAWIGALLGVSLGAGFGALFLLELGGLPGSLGYALILSFALWLGFRANWVLDLKLPEPAGSMNKDAATSEEPRLEKKAPKRLLDMVEIPGGSFLMGSGRDDRSTDDEFPQHSVKVSAFLISECPVTIAQYREVMKEFPSDWSEQDVDDRRPANFISWFDAIRFCNALSEREGFEPCYQIEEQSVKWLRHTKGYRLPTEAEWEYAARAGTQSRYFFGDDETLLREYAWYAKNSNGKTHPVGSLKPNTFGVYDMLGNVWEWCWDWYGPYSEAFQRDPAGPENGDYRLQRGGSAWNDSWHLRSANRRSLNTRDRIANFGFRCVRSLAASD